MEKSDFFEIGVIVNTQGVKGDVRVVPSTDNPKRFDLLTHVFVCRKNMTAESFEIERVWYHKKFVVIKFKGIDDMTAGEKLKQAVLKIESALALPLDDDEYYIRDLIGAVVFDETSGIEVGNVSDVFSTGANDVYTITDKSGKLVYIPAVKEIVTNVDIAAKKITIRAIEGLL